LGFACRHGRPNLVAIVMRRRARARQIIDAHLAGLARHHDRCLVTFDSGLVALHADVAVGLK
jgi:predicted nucleic acid-binding protein